MLKANPVEHFLGRPGALPNHVIQPLANSLVDVGEGRDIEQALIGLRILHGGEALFIRKVH